MLSKFRARYSSFSAVIKREPLCRVLLYHRVGEVKDDPYLLCVSVENFENQIKWLKKSTKVISLLDLVEQLKSKKIESESACVTFDDGYADNYYNALPILKQFQIPATIFVTAGTIDGEKPFFWEINTPEKDRGRPLKRGELIKLGKGPLLEIGSHTLTHPRLSQLGQKKQNEEILQSKINLGKILHKEISGFSYPFGTASDYDRETVELVRKAGYDYACSNIRGIVTDTSDRFELPRFLVRNWGLKEFILRFTLF